MNDTTTTSAIESRLAEFEAVGNRLWPFVRYFAMAGACTDAVDAVVELGRLLGKDADGEAEADRAEEVRDMTIDHVANWLESSPFVRARIGGRIAGELAGELRKAVEQQAIDAQP
jgi:hypothetical protein